MLFPIESYLDNSIIDKIVIADTSFALACHYVHHWYHHEAIRFWRRQRKDNVVFFGNVIVMQELLHILRGNLLLQAVEKLPNSDPDKAKLLEKDRNGKLKFPLDKHLWRLKRPELITSAMIGTLEREFQSVSARVPYEQFQSKNLEHAKTMNKPLDFKKLKRLMVTYCLDSSDAMILNFALSKRWTALVTCDGDFVKLHDENSFNVYMPKKLIWFPTEIH